MFRSSVLWLLPLGLGFLDRDALAGPLEQTQRTATGAIVRIELDRDALELSSSAILTLVIEAPAPLEVEPIKSITTAKTWIAAPATAPETTTLPLGRTRWRQAFRLEPLQADPAGVPLPVEPVRFRAGDEPTPATVAFQPLSVPVTTVVAGPSISGLKDILPPEPLPEPEPFPWGLMGAALAVGLGLLGLGLAGWRRLRAPVAPLIEPTPQAWALQELDRLEALALPAAGAVERYHTLLADVVRNYVARRFGLRAIAQTTQEFLTNLAQSSVLPSAQQEQLRSFLQRCDLAKFARADYSADDCQLAIQLARDFIAQSASASPNSAPTQPSLR